MSVRRNHFGHLSTTFDQEQQSQMYTYDPNIDLVTQNETVESIPSKFTEIVQKLLPHELPFDMSVNNVEYTEIGYKTLIGTLYLSNFRIVFMPDNDTEDNSYIPSGNKYIGEYDIPLASIYKINVAPVDSRTGFKSFLNENQIQSETRTFTILTRDFRQVTFTKCSVTQSNNKTSHLSVTKMEKYIEALKVYSRSQNRQQLYLYNIVQETWNRSPLREHRNYPLPSMDNIRTLDDDLSEYLLGKDDRIRSYMTYDDWREELYEANEERWIVNRRKFDQQSIIKTEGPYIQLAFSNSSDEAEKLVWHWTHSSQNENIFAGKRQVQPQKYMLITTLGVGETTNNVEPLRRVTTDSSLTGSTDMIFDQPFYRCNLSKFPCNLKRLQASYEKLLEICITPQEDDDKWLSKLNGCKWLKFVSKTLHAAASLAKLLDFKNISLVGSDTDYSCLMSSLIQILLRPKCRTMKGFCELIVREWVIRGHKFIERFGQVLYDSNGNPVVESPVFLLFLDCVHQLIVQNPFAFEFTDYLLLELYRAACYCYHHTFVFNDVLERLKMSLNYPKNLLVLSVFDFSLYLDAETCLVLKNYASSFSQESNSSSSNKKKQSRIEATVIYPSAPSLQNTSRTVYYIETSKARKYSADVLVTNSSTASNPEMYDYDTIQSPQIFSNDFQIDWRMFNLVLWSKCYCRHDEDYTPSPLENQLSFDISSIKEHIEVMSKKPSQIILDSFQNVGHANSWQPQTLVTRV